MQVCRYAGMQVCRYGVEADITKQTLHTLHFLHTLLPHTYGCTSFMDLEFQAEIPP